MVSAFNDFYPVPRTMIASAFRTVPSLWAMTKTVRPSMSWSHTLFDQSLGAGINTAGGFIQNEHRRVGDGSLAMARSWRCPCERFLPSPVSMVSYPWGNRRIKEWALASFAAWTISSRLASSFPKRMLSAMVPVKDGYPVRQQPGGGAGRLLDLLYRDAVVCDSASCGIVKPVDQIHHSCFTCAGGTDEGNFLSRFGIQVDVPEDWMSGIVAKFHMVKSNIPRRGTRGASMRSILPGPFPVGS